MKGIWIAFAVWLDILVLKAFGQYEDNCPGLAMIL